MSNKQPKTLPLIIDDASYRSALARLERLFVHKHEDDRAERRALSLLIEDYERLVAPREEAYDPVGAIREFMDRHGYKQSDLVRLTNLARNRVSEYLNRKRPIPLSAIRAFNDIGVPLGALVGTGDAPDQPLETKSSATVAGQDTRVTRPARRSQPSDAATASVHRDDVELT